MCAMLAPIWRVTPRPKARVARPLRKPVKSTSTTSSSACGSGSAVSPPLGVRPASCWLTQARECSDPLRSWARAGAGSGMAMAGSSCRRITRERTRVDQGRRAWAPIGWAGELRRIGGMAKI